MFNIYLCYVYVVLHTRSWSCYHPITCSPIEWSSWVHVHVWRSYPDGHGIVMCSPIDRHSRVHMRLTDRTVISGVWYVLVPWVGITLYSSIKRCSRVHMRFVGGVVLSDVWCGDTPWGPWVVGRHTYVDNSNYTEVHVHYTCVSIYVLVYKNMYFIWVGTYTDLHW
jgi:hypothetical protein